jgi:hypothetical protein
MATRKKDHGTRGPPLTRPAPQLFGVLVGSEAIVGFRYPTEKVLGKGDNVPRSGEMRVAMLLIAVLGEPSPLQHKFDNSAGAVMIAGEILRLNESVKSVTIRRMGVASEPVRGK